MKNSTIIGIMILLLFVLYIGSSLIATSDLPFLGKIYVIKLR